MTSTFKILLVGDGNVGKTTFRRRLLNKDWREVYIPSRWEGVSTITNGDVTFEIWDTCGVKDEKAAQRVYGHADGLVLMFSFDSLDSYLHLEKWLEETRAVTGDIPTVVCGNKADCEDRVIEPQEITFTAKHSLKYFEISTKTTLNCEKPLAYLAGQLIIED
jgi:GTP-binding nuclear protein Ran